MEKGCNDNRIILVKIAQKLRNISKNFEKWVNPKYLL